MKQSYRSAIWDLVGETMMAFALYFVLGVVFTHALWAEGYVTAVGLVYGAFASFYWLAMKLVEGLSGLCDIEDPSIKWLCGLFSPLIFASSVIGMIVAAFFTCIFWRWFSRNIRDPLHT
jgi:hypothetical protein